MVGCVIVNDSRIIGEGWHQKYGGPHAEVNAVNNVVNKNLLKGADVYVTLEPCSHYGKTPPCCDLLISHQVKNVFIANKDPNPLVMGKGIKRLQDAGIVVHTGLLKAEGASLNQRFFTCMLEKRPYVILKYAKTFDGFIARENYDSKWISNASSRKLVHKWRAEEDAILVGKNTALYDDPELTVRSWNGSNPVRILIDHQLALSTSNLNLFDGSVETICYNIEKSEHSENIEFVKLDPRSFLLKMLSDMNKRGLQSVIVEGGAKTIKAFIQADLWDEARVFTSPVTFEKGIEAPFLTSQLSYQHIVKGDTLKVYTNYSSLIL